MDENERQVSIGGPQQRGLLAVLLLNANRVVSAERLVEYLWGEQPPQTARGLLQGCVAGLRRVLKTTDAFGARQPLVSRAPGYLIEVRAGELDLVSFEELVAKAAAVADDSVAGLEERSALLTRALELWRGPVVDGINLDPVRVEGAHLEERRLAALEERIEVDLRLDRHAALIGELRGHVRTHPLRERFWALLIRALAAAGRQADALAAYAELRENLVDELGMEPSATVQELHRQLLAGPPATAAARPRRDEQPRGTVPAQLPAPTSAFTGRSDALRTLDELLSDTDDAVAIGVISGTPGVGKTTLAVHWAHRVRDRFQDGQLYVNLRGFETAPPLRPIDALAGFLRALGVRPNQVPVDVDQAAALYRSLLAGKRVLVVLDNARSAEQVRPLLPGNPGCAVVVTSRQRLGGLIAREGGHLVSLDVLSSDEAQELLAELLGPERLAVEPASAAELVQLCAKLPLALRISAAGLAVHPEQTIASYVDHLQSSGRLDALRLGDDEDVAVRGAFDLSYEGLDPQARKLFRLLGLVPGPDVTVEAAAALLDRKPSEARALMAQLATAHLVGQVDLGRYSFHDLLRLYAESRAVVEDSAEERAAAVERLYGWYLDAVGAAANLLYPLVLRLQVRESPRSTHADATAALSWLDAERTNLVAAVVHASARGVRPASAWLLADAIRGYFWLRRHSVDWLAVAQAAQALAEEAGDFHAQAAAHFSLGMAYLSLNQYAEAIEHQQRAFGLSRKANWQAGQVNALTNLGLVHFERGDLDVAAAHHVQALSINRRLGSVRGEGFNLKNLGHIALVRGELSQAREHLEQALRHHEKIDDLHGRAADHTHLGELHHRLGSLGSARSAFEEAIDLHRQVGNVNGEGGALGLLALLLSDLGVHDSALEHAERAVALVKGTSDRYTEAGLLNVLGTVRLRMDAAREALSQHLAARHLAAETSARYPETSSQLGLALAYQRLGDLKEGLAFGLQATTSAHHFGFAILEGDAHVVLGGIRLEAGEHEHAIAHGELASQLHTATGYRIGQVRALIVLGQALRGAGDRIAAAERWREAQALCEGLDLPEQLLLRDLRSAP
ncbi:AfsR/SARP family transcriptional regulator [Tenggerimyces flavus]|uniref:BTAD domain-containing putative transcriptional regulator n=1 Tax=Tenggerimyces flavus TaxID=1708749 RepID=A0ABV7Y6H5_9ACTN|nr:BTAD domain-containing putative transcriptional regulator [Tenggerimyces flavus]MBM7785312.1 DNA-binding SARP family transcriptional activator/Tfp pilus assembly protein PilF [Tenggerimyces flavus]